MRKEKDLHGVHCAILSSDGITHYAKGSAHLAKADSSIASLFKTATAQAVQSAFLDSFRYLNLSFLNRNLLFKR